MRKTKHSGIGHEDTGYSYVVIRRGVRPTRVHTKVGRIGEVGRRELEKPSRVQAPISELNPDGEQPHSIQEASIVGADSGDIPTPANEEITAALRAEAYSWPRLVFPPLKKSGHIIMDGCTHEGTINPVNDLTLHLTSLFPSPSGKIMRMTIPRSQGKQPFYDARKSSWGDIFPHEPKNRPQERYVPQGGKRQDGIPLKGADIGKRGNKDLRQPKRDIRALEDARHERRRLQKEDRKSKDAYYGD